MFAFSVANNKYSAVTYLVFALIFNVFLMFSVLTSGLQVTTGYNTTITDTYTHQINTSLIQNITRAEITNNNYQEMSPGGQEPHSLLIAGFNLVIMALIFINIFFYKKKEI
jgi:hypothetical protein